MDGLDAIYTEKLFFTSLGSRFKSSARSLQTEIFPVKPPDCPYLGALFGSFLILVQFVSSLKHEVIHELCGFLLLARYEMTINVQGNARLGMSEPFGDNQNWNSMVQH